MSDPTPKAPRPKLQTKKVNWPAIGVIIAGVSGLASVLVAIAALSVSLSSMTKVEFTRVETGSVGSNGNVPDFDNPWMQWTQLLTKYTTYVGVQRKIRFAKPFQNSPKVVAALALINLERLDIVLSKQNYKIADEDERRRLRQLHVVSWPAEVTPNYFFLQVGVGLPVRSADYLIGRLTQDEVDKELLAIHQRFIRIRQTGELTPYEKWMMNFYTMVGSVDVTWVARAEQR